MRRWLTNTRQHRMSATEQVGSVAITPQAMGIATGAISENADVQAALEWLNDGVSQINDAGERMTRPPHGVGSWEEFFEREIAR